jgi:hypothetical protein
MPKSPSQGSGSLLLAEEYFAAEDPRFLEAIRAVGNAKALAGFVDRWKRDIRPFARMQILAYLGEPLDSVGHNVVVKRLFKHAEEQGDDEIMAAMLAAFDVLIRHVRKTRQHYEWRTRESWTEEMLVAPRDVLPLGITIKRTDWRGREHTMPARIPRNGRLFSHRTRAYLRRRAWRYFRKLGYQHPERYVPAITRALMQYQDADLALGENILDTWGLMQGCFRQHAALEFTSSQIRLKEGRSIGELTPAPRFVELWRSPEAAKMLFSLIRQARSRLMRVWAMELLRQEHAARLAEVPVDELFALLEHADEEVQQFAARLLEASPAVSRLPVVTWFKLLGTQNALALEAICRAMQEHVSGNRLSLDDCVRLACLAPAPVARLGLAYLKAKAIVSAEDRQALAAIADTRCAATAGEVAAWALQSIGAAENYDRPNVLRFFDSHSAGVRQAAWQWLVGDSAGARSAGFSRNRGTTNGQSPGYADAGLWCRLLETPYDDLRLPLIDELARRSTLTGNGLPGAGTDDLAPVWCSVLLGVHRGGRQKIKATQQIARKLADDPSQAEKLLPVLAAAVRSVRGPEFRAGLAAVLSAVEARPELGAMVRAQLPELQWEVV